MEDLVRRKKSSLGAGHPSTLASQEILGTSYRMVGRLRDAELLLRENSEVCKEAFGLELEAAGADVAAQGAARPAEG